MTIAAYKHNILSRNLDTFLNKVFKVPTSMYDISLCISAGGGAVRSTKLLLSVVVIKECVVLVVRELVDHCTVELHQPTNVCK